MIKIEVCTAKELKTNLVSFTVRQILFYEIASLLLNL